MLFAKAPCFKPFIVRSTQKCHSHLVRTFCFVCCCLLLRGPLRSFRRGLLRSFLRGLGLRVALFRPELHALLCK